jgi:hypothetical protein
MAGMAGLLVLRFLTQPGNQIAIRRPSSRYGSLLVRSSSKGKIIPRLDVGHEIGWLFVSPDGKLLYVVELFGRTITVIATEDGQIKRKLQLPQAANSAVMAKSGKRLYIGSANSVILYDLSLETVERTISTEFQVFDIAVTPDEKKLFVALGNDGLQRISLPSLESSSLSEFACPMHMAMDSEGKRLFVAYQCSGPSGKSGHDIVEVYDAQSEQRLGEVRDLPMVGGPPIVSPNGDFVLLDGMDACYSKQYDHKGCPWNAPYIFHLVRVSDLQPVKIFPLPFTTMGAAFVPDGKRVIFGGTSLTVMDWSRQAVLEEMSIGPVPFSHFAFTPGGRMFVAAAQGSTGLLVIDLTTERCEPPSFGLVNRFSGEGTLHDSDGTSELTPIGTPKFLPALVGQAFYFKNGETVLKAVGGAACWPCNGNWTESFFAEFNSLDGEMILLDRADGMDWWVHSLFKSGHGEIVMQAGGVSNPQRITVAAPVQLKQWYHIALVADGEKRLLYLDGSPQGEVLIGKREQASTLGKGTVYLGAGPGNRAPLDGMLDELMWYDRALSAEEVKNLAALPRRKECRP